MHISEFTLRVLTALASGAFIGLERQLHHKSAGLRTNSLVALGAAIFVLVSFEITKNSGGDNTRIIGQVVTGVGFLGAGVILHQGVSVQGLTTAATIWCSAAVGCLAAAGFYLESAICTSIVVLVNLLFRNIDDAIAKSNKNDENQLD